MYEAVCVDTADVVQWIDGTLCGAEIWPGVEPVNYPTQQIWKRAPSMGETDLVIKIGRASCRERV